MKQLGTEDCEGPELARGALPGVLQRQLTTPGVRGDCLPLAAFPKESTCISRYFVFPVTLPQRLT